MPVCERAGAFAKAALQARVEPRRQGGVRRKLLDGNRGEGAVEGCRLSKATATTSGERVGGHAVVRCGQGMRIVGRRSEGYPRSPARGSSRSLIADQGHQGHLMKKKMFYRAPAAFIRRFCHRVADLPMAPFMAPNTCHLVPKSAKIWTMLHIWEPKEKALTRCELRTCDVPPLGLEPRTL